MDTTASDVRLRLSQEKALVRLGDLAYHLNSPLRTGKLPPKVTGGDMQGLAAMRMVDLMQYANPSLGYTLTSAGLRMYCLLTGETPRLYRVWVHQYGEERQEEGTMDMRRAHDLVAELMADPYTSGILRAWYTPA